MSYSLYLDDIRDIPPGCVGARNIEGFRAVLEERGCPSSVSFDYDLYLGSRDQLHALNPTNGNDCLNLFIEMAQVRGWDLSKVIVSFHTINDRGREEMLSTLRAHAMHKRPAQHGTFKHMKGAT